MGSLLEQYIPIRWIMHEEMIFLKDCKFVESKNNPMLILLLLLPLHRQIYSIEQGQATYAFDCILLSHADSVRFVFAQIWTQLSNLV